MIRSSFSHRQLYRSTPNSARSPETSNSPLQYKKSRIEQFVVIHPLLDRLLQLKMAKCLQHGQVRAYQSQNQAGTFMSSRNKIQAPFIQGSMKIMSLKPPTPQVKIDYKPKTARPKTTYTIIRSRTSEPRISRKLEFISNNHHTESQDEELKPSIFIKK